MRMLRSVRLMLLALLISIVPASSHAAVFISVGYAPPPLPVYEQPPCPQPGWLWTPGYWAYGPYGYYWVPGEWVPAPYEGALWTPGYWGWSDGLYVWHPGYWGPQVGYYGGVNYGFGYFGIGFVGGRWRGGAFSYNTAVMRVGPGIRNTYMDRSIVNRYTVARGSHVAYSGGPGGIRHLPTAEERMAGREQHMGRTAFQTQHMNTAMHDRNAYFSNNHGRPQNLVGQQPLGRESRPAFQGRPMNQPQYRAQPQQRQQPQYRAQPQQRQQPQYRAQPQQRQQPQYRAQPQQRQQPQYRAQPQQRQQPQYRAQPQQRSQPQSRPQPRGNAQSKPQKKDHGHR